MKQPDDAFGFCYSHASTNLTKKSLHRKYKHFASESLVIDELLQPPFLENISSSKGRLKTKRVNSRFRHSWTKP